MNKKIDKRYILIIILGFILVFVGSSYALWIEDLYQDNENVMATSCFNVTLEQADSIGLKNAYPLYDKDGKKLTPYTFTIKNNCEAYASYQVNFETLTANTLTNNSFIKLMLNSESPKLLSDYQSTTTTLDTSSNAYVLATGALDVNESKTYELRLWIDEKVTTSDNVQNTKFSGQVTVTASYIEYLPGSYEDCVNKYGADSVQCTIIAEAKEDASLCPTVNDDGTVSITDAETTNALVCSAPDDYGTSYYYRGTVENNWVKFGGYYWRILRVNGDNSIRMIYAGDASVIDALDATTKANVLKNGYNDSSTEYTQIGKSAYNLYWKKDNVENTSKNVYNDNAGVGYMYGNQDGVTEGTTQYKTLSWTSTDTYYVSEEYSYDVTNDKFTLNNPIAVLASEMTTDYIGYYTHNKTSSSSSRNYIYKITSVSVGESSTKVGYSFVRYGTTSKEQAQTNTNDSTIKAYLDNWYATNLAGYETYISDTLFCNDRTIQETIPSGYSNLGYGVEKTAYRWYSKSNGIKLTCQEQNDRFTVDDEVIGNGDLTNPIGLLTSDEAYMAGGYASSNSAYYLYTGNFYWPMSPSDFDGYIALVKVVGAGGTVASSNDVNYSGGGVRPTINLKSGSLTKGSGSASDPWMVD